MLVLLLGSLPYLPSWSMSFSRAVCTTCFLWRARWIIGRISDKYIFRPLMLFDILRSHAAVFSLSAKSRELGRLDPNLYLSETNEDLYDVPLGHLGRVWFTISYDSTAEQLRITIHKARNLRSPNYESLHLSTGIMPTDMTSLSLLTPVPTQDCRIR